MAGTSTQHSGSIGTVSQKGLYAAGNAGGAPTKGFYARRRENTRVGLQSPA